MLNVLSFRAGPPLMSSNRLVRLAVAGAESGNVMLTVVFAILAVATIAGQAAKLAQ